MDDDDAGAAHVSFLYLRKVKYIGSYFLHLCLFSCARYPFMYLVECCLSEIWLCTTFWKTWFEFESAIEFQKQIPVLLGSPNQECNNGGMRCAGRKRTKQCCCLHGFLSWYTLKERAQKVSKINESLKMQSTLLRGKHQPKYKCPCCEKLWGSKLKSNWQFFALSCLEVRAINDCKPWPVVVKASQTTNALGWQVVKHLYPPSPKKMHSLHLQTSNNMCCHQLQPFEVHLKLACNF